jgi:peptide/nickel transport system substrate-binding protein
MMFRTQRRGRFTPAVTAVAIAAVIGLTGCSGGGGEAEPTEAVRGGTLTFAANFGPTSLDPVLQGVDQVNNFYINVAYDTLTRLNGDGTVSPDLATEWEYVDPTTFQLTLREDVQFSDGTDLTAEAVVASLEYAYEKGVNGPNWMGDIEEISAVDDLTVQITTGTPNDSLPQVLSQRMLLGSIISPAGLEDVEGLKSATFGSGPYMLDPDQTVAGDTYTYVPNPYYWDESKIHWEEVVIKVAGNTTAALQAIQVGEADFMSGDATTGAAAQSAGLGVATAPFGLTGINIMDREGTIVPALADPNVRQALLYAIDREGLSEAVFPGFSDPGNAMFRQGFPGYSEDADNAYAYDLDKAKDLMAESDFPDGFSVDIAAPTSNNTNIMAQAVIESWAQLGVTANLVTYTDLGQMTTDILAKKFPITAYNYGALPTFIEATSFFNGGATQFNAFNTTNDELTELLEAAASAGEDSDAAYQEVVELAQVDLAWLSVSYVREQIAIYDGSTVDGFTLGTANPIPDIWNIVPAS